MALQRRWKLIEPHKFRRTLFGSAALSCALLAEVGFVPAFGGFVARAPVMLLAAVVGWLAVRVGVRDRHRGGATAQTLLVVLPFGPLMVLLSASRFARASSLDYLASSVLAGLPTGLGFGALLATLVYLVHPALHAENTDADAVTHRAATWMFAMAALALAGVMLQLAFVSLPSLLAFGLLLHCGVFLLAASALVMWSHFRMQSRALFSEELREGRLRHHRLREAAAHELTADLPRIGLVDGEPAAVVEGESVGYRDERRPLFLIPRDW